MTYGQVRDTTLKLLRQYSIAGSPVSASYNNQQDYLNAIPALVNDALMEIATTVKKIPVTIDIDSLPYTEFGDKIRYELPEDFYQFKSGETLKETDDGRILHTSRFMREGKSYLLVPKHEAGKYTITYYRYPQLLSEQPTDNDAIDNTIDTHFAIPFYVASFLVADDSEFLCSLFYNKFEDKLMKTSAGVSVETVPISDEYNFGYMPLYTIP